MKETTKQAIDEALKLIGGRSRPDKSMPFVFKILKNFVDYKWSPKILDIGCGRGSIGYILYTEYGDIEITGIEVFKEYIKDSPYIIYYDDIINDNYISCYGGMLDYDVYLFIDVLEHFERRKAIEIIEFLKAHDKTIILSIPIAPKHWHQAESFEKGNIYEKHLHNWTIEEVETVLGLRIEGSYDAIGVFSNV